MSRRHRRLPYRRPHRPDYAPSQQALLVSGPRPRRSDAHAAGGARAELAEEASRLAGGTITRAPCASSTRRPGSRRAGPRVPYRANVAYLKGDTPAAVAALKRGLEIEPDNILFRENLKNLQRPKTP